MSAFLKKCKEMLQGIHWLEFSLWMLMAAAFFVVDIVTKHVAYNALKDAPAKNGFSHGLTTGIPYILDFTLVFNNGAAWNIGAGMKPLLSMISLIMGLVIFGAYLFGFKKLPRFARAALALAFSGCIGNLVDRFGFWMGAGIYAQGGVIDFLVFDFWRDFPVFNVADSCLVVGIAILIVGYIVVTIQSHIKASKVKEENPDIDSIDDLKMNLKKKEETKSLDADAKEETPNGNEN